MSKSAIYLNLIFLLFFSLEVRAQYPQIPEDLQARTDSIMEVEEQRLQQKWEQSLKILAS